MELVKKIASISLMGVVLLGIALITGPGAKAATQAAQLRIATEVSNDGQTWTTAPICVDPGKTYQYRTTVWNEGETTARQIYGSGELTNGNYIQSVSANTVDEDGDGYGYRGNFCDPQNPNGYLTWAPAGTTKDNGQAMTTTVRIAEDAPCGSITCEEILETYDTHMPTNDTPQAFIGRALAHVEYATGDRTTAYTVTVNRTECPCVSGATSLPNTGSSLLDTVKSVLN